MSIAKQHWLILKVSQVPLWIRLTSPILLSMNVDQRQRGVLPSNVPTRTFNGQTHRVIVIPVGVERNGSAYLNRRELKDGKLTIVEKRQNWSGGYSAPSGARQCQSLGRRPQRP